MEWLDAHFMEIIIAWLLFLIYHAIQELKKPWSIIFRMREGEISSYDAEQVRKHFGLEQSKE